MQQITGNRRCAGRADGELGARIDRAAAGLLADFVNGEPARIRTELEKLAAYANGEAITPKMVETLVVSEKEEHRVATG